MGEYDQDILRLAGEGSCCAQILLQLALEMQGAENPGLLRAMQGLCEGGGDLDGTCGALSGGLCLLCYYAGKAPGEMASDRLPLLMEQLRQWFCDLPACAGGLTCGAIAPSEQEHFTVCPGVISATAEQVFSLLMAEGIELDTLKEEL